MAKQNGSLNKKLDQTIERLDALIGIVDSIDKTLRRHERILEHHGKFVAFLSFSSDLKTLKRSAIQIAFSAPD